MKYQELGVDSQGISSLPHGNHQIYVFQGESYNVFEGLHIRPFINSYLFISQSHFLEEVRVHDIARTSTIIQYPRNAEVGNHGYDD